MAALLIDLDCNNIITIVENAPLLQPHQRSQLSLLGFKPLPGEKKYTLLLEHFNYDMLEFLDYLNKEGLGYSLSNACQLYVDNLTSSVKKIASLRDSAQNFKQGILDSERFKKFEHNLNEIIYRKLKHHQLAAAYHLYLVENGANFSVPGSGKTSVVLSVFAELKKENKVNTLFVVGPPSCFGPWKNEFYQTFNRQPDCTILSGVPQKLRQKEYYNTGKNLSELYLTTYQTLLNDQNDVKSLFEQMGANVYFVIDEAHYMKRLQGNWATAVLGLADYARFRCVLTGTPVPKSYSDIFNITDFLWPSGSVLGSSAKTQITLCENEHRADDAKTILKSSFSPFFYRVKKADLGLKPPIFHPPHLIEMNKWERLVYDAIDKQIRSYSKADYMKNIDVVKRLRRGRIIRLRQCVSLTSLLRESVEGYGEDLVGGQSDVAKAICSYAQREIPAKVLYLEKMLQDYKKTNRKVVIWANFVGTLKYLKEYLLKTDYNCDLIYGKTPVENSSMEDERTREVIRDEFVDPKSGLDILLANPAACAESISLHKTCHDAIYYDLSYNCAQYLQSLDRIHRVGGSEEVEVHYFYLQYRDTIESDIKNNLEAKAKKMSHLIDEDMAIYSLDMFEDDDEDDAFLRIYGAKSN